jgi:flagellar motor switch protein FliN
MGNRYVTSFVETVAAALSGVLSQLTGRPVTPAVSTEASAAEPELWTNACLRTQPDTLFALGITSRDGLLFARSLLSLPMNADTTLSGDDREALAEFWRQVFGHASTALSSLNTQLAIDYVDGSVSSFENAVTEAIRLDVESHGSVQLVVRLSPGLVRALTSALEYDKELPSTRAVLEEESKRDNLSMLLDVPLAVKLRFGQRRLPLREILQLASGTVIELDRNAEEPVELMLEERLIARGEVVVVDGCYGLRVTEVCRNTERLR